MTQTEEEKISAHPVRLWRTGVIGNLKWAAKMTCCLRQSGRTRGGGKASEWTLRPRMRWSEHKGLIQWRHQGWHQGPETSRAERTREGRENWSRLVSLPEPLRYRCEESDVSRRPPLMNPWQIVERKANGASHRLVLDWDAQGSCIIVEDNNDDDERPRPPRWCSPDILPLRGEDVDGRKSPTFEG